MSAMSFTPGCVRVLVPQDVLTALCRHFPAKSHAWVSHTPLQAFSQHRPATHGLLPHSPGEQAAPRGFAHCPVLAMHPNWQLPGQFATVRGAPQLSVPLNDPHTLPRREQNVASDSLVHPHTFGVPPPLQVSGALQLPQLCTVRATPQLSVPVTVPQALPRREQKVALVSLVHVLQTPVPALQPNWHGISEPHWPFAPHVCALLPLHRWLFGEHTPPHRPVEVSQMFMHAVGAA
jgi:hypothetical protein